MAATFGTVASGVGSVHPEKVPGSFFDAIITVTAGTTDYAAGGYAFSAAQLQTLFGGAYSAIESVEIAQHWTNPAGAATSLFVAYWDKVNKKVQAFGMNAAAAVSNPLTEVGAATANMNGLQCQLRVRFY